MSQSWSLWTDKHASRFDMAGDVTDTPGIYRYRVKLDNGRLVQQETSSRTPAYSRLEAAEYVVGSGNHASAFVSADNGYLSQLPVGWFADEGRWKLNPGYELANHRFDRPIVPGCLACHGGFAIHRPATRNRYELPVEGGIGCEACHGPGRQHVALHQSGRPDDTAAERDPIVNPARLSAPRANDVCLQCHLQGDVVVYRDGADEFSFRPGDRLSDHRSDFLIQTDAPEAFGVASHGARLLRSRCRTPAGDPLTCQQCHDPHRPTADFARNSCNATCLQCHQPADCPRQQRRETAADAGGCINCHMPQRPTREGQHLVFTDHWIRVAPSAPFDEAPPRLEANADVDLQTPWPDDEPAQAHLGMACIRLHYTMGPQLPSVDRGIEILSKALVSDPDNPAARYWLGSGYLARHRSAAAVRELADVLQTRPDWHQARFRLAVAYHQQQRVDEAIREYRRVIEAVPDWLEPYPQLIRLYLQRGEVDAALPLIEQQIAFRPDATAWLNLALARQLSTRPLQECLAPIDNALHLDPENATAFLTRAFIHAQAGRIVPARSDYRRALEIDPDNREAQAGLNALRGFD